MKEKRRKRQPEEIHEKEVSSADEKSSSAKERGRKKKRKGRTGVTILLFVILAVGAGVLIYPTFSNWWNSFHQTRAIAGYVDTVDDMGEEEAAKLLAEAEAWNQALLSKPDRYHLTDEQRAAYDSILDITGTGIMGYIDIPSIDVSLPIYHGTSESVLQIAIGHLEWSSFPVGGVGTHAALSGHRGLPSARLFTDIDQLKEGDHFLIQVLTRTLTYEVDQIRTVLPQEMSDLELDATEDYVTLITCTPYGVNTHRLLIRGHRIENDPEEAAVTSRGLLLSPIIFAPLFIIAAVIALIAGLIFRFARRRWRRRHHKEDNRKKKKR